MGQVLLASVASHANYSKQHLHDKGETTAPYAIWHPRLRLRN